MYFGRWCLALAVGLCASWCQRDVVVEFFPTRYLSVVMSNEDEVKRMYSMLLNEKILFVFQNKISKKDLKVDYKKFIETAYDKND